jgi:hypothetical protein
MPARHEPDVHERVQSAPPVVGLIRRQVEPAPPHCDCSDEAEPLVHWSVQKP